MIQQANGRSIRIKGKPKLHLIRSKNSFLQGIGVVLWFGDTLIFVYKYPCNELLNFKTLTGFLKIFMCKVKSGGSNSLGAKS